MKKTYSGLNAVLVLLTVINCVIYRMVGGIVMKGVASGTFALLGLVNLCFALQTRRAKGFPMWMAAALVITAVADVVLRLDFMVGAVIFMAGHAVYFCGYCSLDRLGKRDLLPIAGMLAVTLTIVKCFFRFESGGMETLVLAYGVVISFMLGKAVSNLLRNQKRTRLVLVLGSALFWFSDLMLAWNLFAGGGYLADTLCLFTYWPGQAVLAFSVYLYTAAEDLER